MNRKLAPEELSPIAIKGTMIAATRQLKLLIAFTLLTQTIGVGTASGQSIKEDLFHHRAMESVFWSVPFVQFKIVRDSVVDGQDVGFNGVGYYSKMQTWKMQMATPNDTTPYLVAFWNVKEGPVVIGFPASNTGIGIFGTLMDAWQRPLEDVGATGLDAGRSAKYLILPPGYRGYVPAGYTPIQQETLNGYTALRPIIPDTSEASLKKVVALAKTIKIYPLAKADKPPAMNYVDLYDKLIIGIPTFNASYFDELNEIIQEEIIEEKDLVMLGMLKYIGIEKGVSFKPDTQTREILGKAAEDAHKHLIDLYHTELIPPYYEGTRWTSIVPAGALETGLTYQHPGRLDYQSRGALYYAILSSAKNIGAATFYLSNAKDPQGNWLDGGSSYKLNVPANVPARDFWSVVAYDLESATWILEQSKVGVDSLAKDLQVNSDGSVDVYLGPRAPEGKESNWIPTSPGKRFFIMFRWYGPEKAVFTKAWKLKDLEKL